MLLFPAGRPEQHRRTRPGRGEVRVEARLVDVVEEREQPVIVALRNWIESVVVAARAFDRQPEHGGPERVDAIDDVFGAELLVDAAALVGLAMEAIERGGDALL